MSLSTKAIRTLWQRLRDPVAPSRLLGLDIGSRFVGVSISDETCLGSYRLCTLERSQLGEKTPWRSPVTGEEVRPVPQRLLKGKKRDPNWKKFSSSLGFTGDGWYRPNVPVPIQKFAKPLRTIIKQNNVIGMVVGVPLTLQGTLNPQTPGNMVFINELQQHLPSQLQIIWWDERMTTVEARELLIEAGVKRDQWKKHEDELAASIILEDFLMYASTVADTR